MIGSGSAAVWAVLALTVLPALHLQPVTVAAAGAIIAVQAGALAYAVWVARWSPGRRQLDHLGWLAQLCQILGLLGTVAGFILEMRALAGVGDATNMAPLIGQMSRGLATAMVSTFCGVLASVTISLAQHSLDC